MYTDVEIIDSKGFWHKKNFKSKSLVLIWLKALKKGTDIQWKSKNSVWVSQQYLQKEERSNIENKSRGTYRRRRNS